MNDQILEGEFFLFSDFAVEHNTDAEEEVLEDVGIDFRLVRRSRFCNRIEGRDILSDQLPLKNSSDLGRTFDFGYVILINLGSHCLQKLLLFPTLVFHFLFYEVDKFAALFRVS